ncbi:MAG: PIG-L family deacetylase [Chloroflexi bacterium]|nr:MAG: PIG-L family deacetylase [Chloroflexota bacterium]
MRVLAIAAHPDDETIGAGGAIARHVAHGDEVYWCIVTQGYSPPWSEETLAEARSQVDEVQEVLGFREVFLLGFPTVKLNTVPYIDLCSALQQVVDQVQPEIVYTTPRDDINQDHRIVYEATLVAARPLPGSSVRRLLCYEISTTARFGLPAGSTGFAPNVFVDISRYLEKKLEAIRCYRTELREYPHPRSVKGLRLLAEERGLNVGLQAAECFQLVRELL